MSTLTVVTPQPQAPLGARPRYLPRIVQAACLLVALFLLASCAAGPGASDAQAPAMNAAASAEDAGTALDGGSEGGAAADREAGGSELPPVEVGAAAGQESELMMIRKVQVEIVVDDVGAAVSRARAAATSAGGWVSSEEVTPSTQDRAGWATMIVRVPSADLDAVVTELNELGTVTSSSSRSEDVTTEYRDVEARVATLEAGADRLRDLVAEAGSVESIATLERELADREAELDALKARMKVMAQDVSRSTITLHLAEDRATLAQAEPATGFGAGLQQGWKAFTASVAVLLTAAGALLPFVGAAALVGVPALLWLRRRRASRSSSTPVAAAPEQTPPPSGATS